ncbi:MAG: hypothetical protein AAB558_01565 [Patescibacteria group bacterium]
MRKFFATICAILFILLAPLTVVASVVQVKFFTPQGVKLLLRAGQIGEYLPQLLSSAFTNLSQEEFSQEEVDPFAQFGGQAVFEDALGKVLPPEDVYAILDQAVETIFTWWKTDQPIQDLPLVIDLSRPKQRLAPIVLESVKQYIDSLPTCTADQLREVQGSSDLPDVFSLACAPEGFTLDSFAEAGISEEALSGILLASVPDQFNVQEFLQQMQQSDPQQLVEMNQQVESVRHWLRIAYTVLRVLQISLLVCFLLVGLLRLTPVRALFAWVGWILFLPGLELLGLSFMNSFVPGLVEKNLLASNPDSVQIVPILQMTSAVTQSLSRPILWVGLGMTVAGLVSIIVGKIFKRQSHTTASTQTKR